jgi:hypothetical protein
MKINLLHAIIYKNMNMHYIIQNPIFNNNTNNYLRTCGLQEL